MCLGIPAKVVAIEGSIARVDMMGNERMVGLDLVPEAVVGDHVLVHAGFAISIVDPETARETEALLLEVAQAYEDGE